MTSRGSRLLLPLIAASSLAACSVEVDPAAVPLPFDVSPTTSASAGVAAHACTAAYQILTDGAVRLTGVAGDPGGDGLRETFAGIAARIEAEAAQAVDAPVRQALSSVATDLRAGADQADPKAYLHGGFMTVGQKLDEAC